MKIIPLFILCAALPLLPFTVFLISLIKWKKLKNITRNIIAGFLLVINIISLANVIAGGALYRQAILHGMYTNDLTLDEFISGIKNSPKEDTLPETKDELKGTIIIYYRFGCHDCESVYHDLVDYIDENDIKNIYFISTRSEQGQALMRLYPIGEVPTAIYIHADNADRFTKKVIYKEENGKSALDIDALDRLKTLQQNKR